MASLTLEAPTVEELSNFMPPFQQQQQQVVAPATPSIPDGGAGGGAGAGAGAGAADTIKPRTGMAMAHDGREAAHSTHGGSTDDAKPIATYGAARDHRELGQVFQDTFSRLSSEAPAANLVPQELRFAVFGVSGTGKSSLLNTVYRVCAGHEFSRRFEVKFEPSPAFDHTTDDKNRNPKGRCVLGLDYSTGESIEADEKPYLLYALDNTGAVPSTGNHVAPDLDVAGTGKGCEDYAGLGEQVNKLLLNPDDAFPFPCQAALVTLDCAALYKACINGHGEAVATNLKRVFARLHRHFARYPVAVLTKIDHVGLDVYKQRGRKPVVEVLQFIKSTLGIQAFPVASYRRDPGAYEHNEATSAATLAIVQRLIENADAFCGSKFGQALPPKPVTTTVASQAPVPASATPATTTTTNSTTTTTSKGMSFRYKYIVGLATACALVGIIAKSLCGC